MAHDRRALIASILSDTVASVGDLIPARTLPVWTIGVLIITAELFFAYMTRDNLVLSVVQFTHPSKAISNWWCGGRKRAGCTTKVFDSYKAA